MDNKCPGSGMEPRCTIQNDWMIGTTCVCPFCGKSCRLPKGGKMPTHKVPRSLRTRPVASPM